ncbi:hypothetical protein [Amycolatopsis sp. Hca4]|uniref:hypothetical protein n=1 Tax=Amycolatopsis sp. Hca4 TaxID=2742131 RepID=UPI0020CACE74|nr:hypothetical protein [Amycolatopsis sp. Hca4]
MAEVDGPARPEDLVLAEDGTELGIQPCRLVSSVADAEVDEQHAAIVTRSEQRFKGFPVAYSER